MPKVIVSDGDCELSSSAVLRFTVGRLDRLYIAHCTLAVWIKVARKGSKFMSLSFKACGDQQMNAPRDDASFWCHPQAGRAPPMLADFPLALRVIASVMQRDRAMQTDRD